MRSIVACGDTTLISDIDIETELCPVPIKQKDEKENTNGNKNPFVCTNKNTNILSGFIYSEHTRITKKCTIENKTQQEFT